MKSVSRTALIVLALVSAATPVLAQGWRHHYGRHHHHGWSGYGYAPAVSDFYHRSRMLVGTR